MTAAVGGWAVAALGAALAAAPPLATDGTLEPQAEVQRAAAEAWGRMEALYREATGVAPPEVRAPVRIRRGARLVPGRSGESRPGVVEVRQAQEWVVDEKVRVALRHELAHQFLWGACPAASRDRLFHEAFAVAVSGELSAWTEGEYLSLSRAARMLGEARSLDTKAARRALARVLVETTEPGGQLSGALQRRLRLCQAGARWAADVTVEELASRGPASRGAAEAFVVLARHSGEVLVAEGDVRTPLPFGSTLKPFVVAGAAAPPLLAPRPGQPGWECGEGLPARVDGVTAVLRSCNGYFLDWGQSEPAAAKLGAFGPALVALGLPRLPEDMAEAIGLRATLALSPLALAQAYRLLAESRPDVVTALEQNVEKGTLSGLGEVSAALAGVATKTGTVRDSQTRPEVGWIVAVDGERVAIMVRTGKMPRSFAGELARRLGKVRAEAGQRAVEVQVFGLLPAGDVQARCPGVGFVVVGGKPEAVGRGYAPLERLVARGEAVCLAAGWRVRFPGVSEKGREYAGVFARSPAPAYRPPPGMAVTERQRKARRGSDFVFRTSEARYTAGVLASEDARLRGEARAALARVVAHNARHGNHRHPGRPVCDTTHCQAFQGTAAPRPGDVEALGKPPLPVKDWLAFSKGGQEPWTERRPRARVEAVLGAGASLLRFADGKVRYVRTATSGGSAPYDAEVTLPCELLRSPLKLPACPVTARPDGGTFVFEGRGQGHGEGLDVEWARQSNAGQDEILRQAYGFGGG